MLNENEIRLSPVDITEKSNGLFEKRIENTRIFSKIDLKDDTTDLHNPYHSAAYARAYQRSLDSPEHFWAEVGQGLVWTKPWTKVLDNSNEPFTKWFVGGELNACYNTIDRHVEANKGQNVALIHDSPLTQTVRRVTYAELQHTVSRLAGVLASLGVTRSDRVLIYMPLIPEAVAAMLATVRLGAIHSVVFGGFAARELRSRIEHAEPKVIIAASCGVEPNKIIKYKDILNEALDHKGFKPSRCIIFQRRNVHVCSLKPEMDLCWDQAIASAKPHPCVSVEANHPLYILYTSGTTDDPKGIQRPTGGHLAALSWSMGALYGLQPGSVWWSASDLGWVVGHSYICYGPLLAGITSVMYEGKPDRTPDPGQYFRIIHEHRVNAMFTVPTSFRVIKRLDPDVTYGRQYSTESLRTIFVAGEHCDYETKAWVQMVFQVPVLNHWWQTETGHAITASCVGLGHNLNPPNNCAGMPFPGFDVQILRPDGVECLPHELGRIACRLPLPPGTASTLYKAPERFLSVYFDKYPGYYDTMDAGYKDEFGYIYVTARDDDVINVAGHRLSTSGLEDVVLGHPDISDAAVVGVPEPTKGEVPLCLFVMRPNAHTDESTIVLDLVRMVRNLIGPIAVFRLAAAVPALPRTRSGKTLRKAISDLARNKRVLLPGTVEDPTVFVAIKAALQRLGYAHLAPDPQ